MDWLHFRGLFKWLAFLGAIAFVGTYAQPAMLATLAFSKREILDGEVWRLFTFILIPTAAKAFSPVGALFVFFAVRIAILINDSLEGIWGSTRMTLYLLSTWLCLTGAQYFFELPPYAGFNAGGMFYTSVFLAFATLFPRVEFSLFLLIPVEVRFLGWLAGLMMALNGIMHPETLMVSVPGMIPYALWVLPGVVQTRKTLVSAVARRRKFTIAKGAEGVPFHVCEVCRRTEHDPADLEFFVTADGKEYCSEHLPPQPPARS